MSHNLQQLLFDWKNTKTSLNEVRSINENALDPINGHYTIVLKMSVRVVDLGRSETVALSRKIILNQEPNPAEGFAAPAQQLVKDFEKKCALTYTRLSNSQNPDHNSYS